jgi:hypothetical protein
MSHFTSIKTQIRDVESLRKALADVGFSTVEVHDTPQGLYGFEGNLRPETAEMIVRRKYIGSASNDIGFKRQVDGQFTAIISNYDRGKYSQEWVNQLTQRYAYHALIARSGTEGFSIESEESLEDGTLRVVVGKWV